MTRVIEPLSTDALDLDWDAIVGNIEWLASRGCYEKLNRVISLGLVGKLRLRAAIEARGSDVIADVGCGPGTSSTVIRMANPHSKIILVDPSKEMLSLAIKNVDGLAIATQGVFEKLPIKDSSVDSIVAMFSFRDSIDYEAALNEFIRVLDERGRLIILDIFRPSNGVVRVLAKLYLLVMSYIASLLTLCLNAGKRYSSIVNTLDRMYTLNDIYNILANKFKKVRVVKGAVVAHIVIAEEPLKYKI